MNIKRLREVIVRNTTLDPNDDLGQEKCWKEMTDILSENISATISFIESECTDEEFYWLGAVFEDVAEKTQCKEFIQVLRNYLAEIVPETYCQQSFKSEYMKKWVDYKTFVRSVGADIDFAESRIDE